MKKDNYKINEENEKIEEIEEGYIIDCISPDEKWAVIFEDNGETGYMYLCYWESANGLEGIVDHLWVYNQIQPPIQESKEVYFIWSDDSTRVGLVVDGECWGIFDIKNRRKISAPRIDNFIKSIEMKYWENGINSKDGEKLLFKSKRD